MGHAKTTEAEVWGTSMRPLLRNGDRVRARRVSAADLRLGDLVLCVNVRAGAPLVVHRLVWKRRTPGGWSLRTKGDSCRRLDPALTDAAVVGVVVEIRRGGRWRRADAGRGRLAHLAIGLGATFVYGLCGRAYDAVRPGLRAITGTFFPPRRDALRRPLDLVDRALLHHRDEPR